MGGVSHYALSHAEKKANEHRHGKVRHVVDQLQRQVRFHLRNEERGDQEEFGICKRQLKKCDGRQYTSEEQKEIEPHE